MDMGYEKARIMVKNIYLLNVLKPIRPNDLIRLGDEADGGYVVSKQALEHTEALLSLGIADNFSFEYDFLKHKKVLLHGYDCAVYFVSPQVYTLHVLVKAFFRILQPFRPKRFFGVKIMLERLLKDRESLQQIHKFYDGQGKHFFAEMIAADSGVMKDKKYKIQVPQIAFKDAFHRLKSDSVFLKMDIEGGEYAILDSIIENKHMIPYIVAEFHDCTHPENRKSLLYLLQHYTVQHIAINDVFGVNENTDVQDLMEITLMRNDICDNENICTEDISYPIEGLDYSNNADDDTEKYNIMWSK